MGLIPLLSDLFKFVSFYLIKTPESLETIKIKAASIKLMWKILVKLDALKHA